MYISPMYSTLGWGPDPELYSSGITYKKKTKNDTGAFGVH